MYLIDGNNVMGQQVGWHRDKSAARKKLLSQLAHFYQQKKTRLAVVFDGAPEINIADGSSYRGVKVYYARQGSDADNRIIEFVEREQNRQALTVVTSDRQLLGVVRASGVKVIRSGEFRKMMEQAAAQGAATELQVDDKNMGEWMRYFGVDESDNEE